MSSGERGLWMRGGRCGNVFILSVLLVGVLVPHGVGVEASDLTL